MIHRLCSFVLLIATMPLACSGPTFPPSVGTLERDRIDLIAETDDPIIEIAVREGDEVADGSLLVRLDPARLTAGVAQAQAIRDEAAARLAEAVRGPRVERIAEARARLAGARSAAVTSEKELKRAKALAEVDFASRSRLDEFQNRWAAALANGDVLLCGPRAAAAGKTEAGRWHTDLWYLGARLDRPALPLGEPCFEGPAVARHSLRIAWTRSEYPDRVVFGRSEIWVGEIALDGASPRLVNRRKVLDRSDFFYLAFLETQDLRPPDEREFIFTAYAYRGGEVMGVDLETGALSNYSQNWSYDEAEGVFPNGRHVAVEREPGTYTLTPRGHIDIWRNSLDEVVQSVRLTHFSDYAGFGATNPVVRPDGKVMAFQLRLVGGQHGNGHGILLYDLEHVPESAAAGPSHGD